MPDDLASRPFSLESAEVQFELRSPTSLVGRTA